MTLDEWLAEQAEQWLERHAEQLGEAVRVAWVKEQSTVGNPKPHHLTPWSELDEWNKHVDREIGKAVARLVMELQFDQG
jgi:hypothetical protein